MRGRVQSQEVCGPHGRPCPSVSRSKHAFGPHGRPSSVPVRDARPAARAALLRAETPPAGQARPRAAQAALRRAPTLAAARAALLRAEAPAAGQARPRAAQAALRRAMAATTARLRCGPHRRPSAVPSCRRVRSGREVRPRSPGHGSSGREAHSMSSVSVIMTCSPAADRTSASSSSGW